jgi:hypothetical protein
MLRQQMKIIGHFWRHKPTRATLWRRFDDGLAMACWQSLVALASMRKHYVLATMTDKKNLPWRLS